MTSMPLDLHRAEARENEAKAEEMSDTKMVAILLGGFIPLYLLLFYTYFHLDHVLGNGNW